MIGNFRFGGVGVDSKSNLMPADAGGCHEVGIFKLTLLKNSLCVYHCFLDNDEAGRQAYEAAESDGLVTIKNNTFITCNGSQNTEFEDCLELALYRNDLLNEFGVDLDCPEFRGNRKWSDRVRQAFLNQGKPWNNGVEARIKYFVAKCVSEKPNEALNQHKRNSIYALVRSLELLVQS